MDRLSKDQRRKNMQAVRSTGSIIERRLGRALWRKGYRYRKNNRNVFGRPDFTFFKYKIAIFVDSEFWHGKDWAKRKFDHKSNQEFWITKIEGNIKRDKDVNCRLRSDGWIILRFWGKDITRNLDSCVQKIEETIDAVRQLSI